MHQITKKFFHSNEFSGELYFTFEFPVMKLYFLKSQPSNIENCFWLLLIIKVKSLCGFKKTLHPMASARACTHTNT